MIPNIDHVTSKDGTIISYRVFASRLPGLIVVPGALAIAKDFDGLASELAKYFSVYTIDRRGRGGSGPQGADYSVIKELEDIEAIQAKTGAVYLFGHSYGGFIGLEYARLYGGLKKLVVYEPGVSVNNSISMEWAEEAQTYLENGKPLDAFVSFVRSMNPDSAKAPRWVVKTMLPIFIRKDERRQKYALLATTIREHAEEARLDSTHFNYRSITADTLMLRGGKMSVTHAAFDAIIEAVPNIQSKTFEKMDHFGPERQPRIVAAAIKTFVSQSAK